MYSRILELPPQRSLLLLGPRQTGKSTLVRAQLTDRSYAVDLLQHDVYLRYLKAPELLRHEVLERARRGVDQVFVDEIQRVPALLDEVHGLIESGATRFLMTGSSARKLRRGGTNLLAGRATVLHLHPLVVEEHGADFELESALRYGALPAVVRAAAGEKREILESYAQTYLREEIQAEALVRNLGGFGRFLDVIAAQNGELFNAESIARDAAVAARTVREYASVLEDTLLGFRLEPWRQGVRARMAAQPRFHLFDLGVANALNRRLTAEFDTVLRGKLFEQWFVLECRRVLDYARSEARLFFWRTHTGAEVDLVVEKHGRLRGAIEIKAGRRVGGADLSGLRSFTAANPGVPCLIATPDTEPHRVGDVLVTHWREALAFVRSVG
jgi:predicted AAA+ superfamily ATPase